MKSLKPGAYIVDNTCTGTPEDEAWWILDLAVSHGQHLCAVLTLFAQIKPARYWATYNAGLAKWSPWMKFSTATQPQEYDLPLASGITGTAKYYKTQEGLVVIHGWVLGASLNTVLAKLPEGFRPKYYTIRSSISSALNPSIGLIRVEVSVLGEIKITAWNDVGTLASGAAISMDFMSAG